MNTKRGFLIVGMLMVAVLTPIFASAALAPACGNDPNFPCTLCDLFAFIKELTDYLVLAIAPLIAVLAFSIGGFKMLMSGANPGLRQEGIKAIRNGIIGLLIVFGAWIFTSEFLIFFVGGSGGVVSTAPWQEITCIHQKPSVVETALPEAPAGGAYCKSNNDTITAAEVAGYETSNNTNYSSILGGGMQIWSSGAGIGPNALCKQFKNAVLESGSLPPCTSLAYLPASSINALIALQQKVNTYCAGSPGSCTGGSQLIITGGTECGHREHGFNMAPVDLENTSSLTNYFTARHAPAAIQVNVEFEVDGMRILYENSNHFHIRF